MSLLFLLLTVDCEEGGKESQWKIFFIAFFRQVGVKNSQSLWNIKTHFHGTALKINKQHEESLMVATSARTKLNTQAGVLWCLSDSLVREQCEGGDKKSNFTPSVSSKRGERRKTFSRTNREIEKHKIIPIQGPFSFMLLFMISKQSIHKSMLSNVREAVLYLGFVKYFNKRSTQKIMKRDCSC